HAVYILGRLANPTRSRMMSEIEAMGAIDRALNGLKSDEQKRVLRWSIDKFGGDEVSLGPDQRGERDASGSTSESKEGDDETEYVRISDLMDVAAPATTAD